MLRRDSGQLTTMITRFERVLLTSLLLLMMLVVSLGAVDLAWLLVEDIFTSPILLLDVEELLDVFGFFLLILIGIELVETTKAYLHEKSIHVEIVLEVAIIAIARKVIVLDTKAYNPLSLFGVSGLLLALAVSIFLIKRSRHPRPETPNRSGSGAASDRA